MRKRFLMLWGLGTAVAWGQDPEGDLELLRNLMATPVIAANLQLTPSEFAELAVINILTRREAQAEGATAQFWGGGMTGAAPASLAGQVTYGHAWGSQGFTVSYAAGEVANGSGPWPTSAGTVQAGHLGGVR